MGKSTVYFTDFRCPVGTSQLDKLKKVCLAAGIKNIDMDGKFVAIKMHFGELGNLAFLRPNYATEHFPWLIEKYGLRKVRFHDLRHTCASLLLSNGISMKQIQIWLGHSTFSTTADIYAHLDYSAQEASANAMNGMFNRPEKEEQLA